MATAGNYEYLLLVPHVFSTLDQFEKFDFNFQNGEKIRMIATELQCAVLGDSIIAEAW